VARQPKTRTFGRVHARVKRPRPPGEDDGRYYWQAYVVEERKRRTVWTGWATVEELEASIGDVLARGIPERRQVEHDEVRTVYDLAGAWLAEQEDRNVSGELKAKSLSNYRQSVGRIKKDAIADVLVERLDQATMNRWKHRRLRMEKNGASNTVLAEYKVLRMSWKFGQERGVVPARALPTVELNAKPVRPKVTPDAGDVQKLVRRLDGWVRLALWLQFATGARIGEIAGLRWEHVDLDEAEPTVFFPDAKTGPRTVPIPLQLAELLRGVEPKPPGACVLGRAPATTKRMHERIAALCKELEIPRFTSHGIRRLAVELFVDANVDVRAAADHLGNSPKTIWEHYKQTTPKRSRAAMRMAQLGYVAPEPAGEVYSLEDERRKR
jgi:integrase